VVSVSIVWFTPGIARRKHASEATILSSRSPLWLNLFRSFHMSGPLNKMLLSAIKTVAKTYLLVKQKRLGNPVRTNTDISGLFIFGLFCAKIVHSIMGINPISVLLIPSLSTYNGEVCKC